MSETTKEIVEADPRRCDRIAASARSMVRHYLDGGVGASKENIEFWEGLADRYSRLATDLRREPGEG